MGELIIILLLAFLVVGPKDLPKVAVFIAKSIKYIKRLVKDVMSSLDLDEELKSLKEIKQTVDDVKDPKKLLSPVTDEFAEVKKEVKDVNKELKQKIDISK